MQYSESTIYGINLIIKNYAHYPRILPLPCHMEHGWIPLSNALNSDLSIDKPLMLVTSKRRLKAWKKSSNIPCAIMGSPFIHYKNIHKIHRKRDARGTIVFPFHSTEDIDTVFDINKYCNKLKKLPKKFQPITICLFWTDYINKSADIYRKNGFSVISIGPKYKRGLSFARKFYKTLSNYKFASSNEVGSYTFYAVDLGVPFFLLGNIPLKVNSGNNKDMGKSERIDQYYYGRQAQKMFSTGPTTKITPKQKRYVSNEMGIKDCLSPSQMNSLLWHHFKKEKHWIKAIIIYWMVSTLLFFGLAGFTYRVLASNKKSSNRTGRLS